MVTLPLPLGGVIQILRSAGDPIQLAAMLFVPIDYILAALKARLQIRARAEAGWADER